LLQNGSAKWQTWWQLHWFYRVDDQQQKSKRQKKKNPQKTIRHTWKKPFNNETQ